jgi:hypothetical protein
MRATAKISPRTAAVFIAQGLARRRDYAQLEKAEKGLKSLAPRMDCEAIAADSHKRAFKAHAPKALWQKKCDVALSRAKLST